MRLRFWRTAKEADLAQEMAKAAFEGIWQDARQKNQSKPGYARS